MIQGSIQGLGTLGHPGIFIGQSKPMGFKNHLDIPYVTSLMGKRMDTQLDFGVLDLWALKQRTNSPLLTLAIDNSKVIYSDEDYYTFRLPSAAETTCRLVDGGLDKDQMGLDGEPIPFVISKRDLAPGSIFKFDVTSRIQFLVIDRPVEEMGEHFKVWATLIPNAQVQYITKAEFQPGRQIIKLADIRGLDFSSYKSVWQLSGGGLAKYKNYISNAILQQAYRVSTGGVHYLQSNQRFDKNQLKFMEETVMQFYSVRGIADSKVIDLTKDPMAYKEYMEKLDAAKANGNGEAAMINLLDALCVDMIQYQNNNLIVWSDQANILRDGYDTTRLVPGVWFQLDLAGYKHSFSIPLFTLSTITDAIKDFEAGKVDIRDEVSTNVYVIKTGKGGQQLIYKEMIKNGFSVPGVVNNSDHGFITGDANNLKRFVPRFIEYQIPDIGILRVEREPGFDPVMADEYVNPMLASGYRLSSYTMLIEDYNTSRDNIVIIRKNGENIRMKIENGDQSHPLCRYSTSINGQNITWHSAKDELSGYQVQFIGKADTAVVIDPTKLLKLVPKNPRTGIAAL